jgi:hypothetical protein
MKQTLLLLGGAIAGAVLGYFACIWLASQGFYALALPGGLLGLGAGLGKSRSVLPAVLCGLVAVGLGLFTDWHLFPFAKDESLQFYLLHVHDLSPVTLLMIAAGGAIGFYVPFRGVEPRDGTGPGGRGPAKATRETKEGPS